MFDFLKRRLGRWTHPAMAAEVGQLHNELAAAEAEGAALRFALASNHARHEGAVYSLLDVIGALVLQYGGEAAELRVSGDLQAAAAASPPVRFAQQEDGDVVITIPAEEPAVG